MPLVSRRRRRRVPRCVRMPGRAHDGRAGWPLLVLMTVLVRLVFVLVLLLVRMLMRVWVRV